MYLIIPFVSISNLLILLLTINFVLNKKFRQKFKDNIESINTILVYQILVNYFAKDIYIDNLYLPTTNILMNFKTFNLYSIISILVLIYLLTVYKNTVYKKTN
jgi:hypothetical protein